MALTFHRSELELVSRDESEVVSVKCLLCRSGAVLTLVREEGGLLTRGHSLSSLAASS